MKRNTLFSVLVAFALCMAVVAGQAIAAPVASKAPVTQADGWPTYDDAMTVTVGTERFYFSGELLFVDFSVDHPVGNSAGFNAYNVVTDSVQPPKPSFSSARSAKPPVVTSTQWFEVLVYVRDPATNEIVSMKHYQNCIFSGLAYLGGNAHPEFECPPQ